MRKILSLLLLVSFVAVAVFGQASSSPAPSAAPATAAATAKSVEGTVVSFTAPSKDKKTDGQLVIADKNKKETTFVVPATVKVLDAAKKAVAVGLVVKGKTVSVSYVEKSGKLEAESIQIK